MTVASRFGLVALVAILSLGVFQPDVLRACDTGSSDTPKPTRQGKK